MPLLDSSVLQLLARRHCVLLINEIFTWTDAVYLDLNLGMMDVSEALFYTGCDIPFQGPSFGRPILGASNHGYLGLFANFCGFLIVGVRKTQETL